MVISLYGDVRAVDKGKLNSWLNDDCKRMRVLFFKNIYVGEGATFLPPIWYMPFLGKGNGSWENLSKDWKPSSGEMDGFIECV